MLPKEEWGRLVGLTHAELMEAIKPGRGYKVDVASFGLYFPMSKRRNRAPWRAFFTLPPMKAPHFHFRSRLPALPLLLLVLGAWSGLQAADPTERPDDKRLLDNIDSLKTNPHSPAAASVADLRVQLPTLWDRGDAASQPLDIQIVHTESKNGIKADGIYINGYKGATGQDRLFFYYARPEKIDGRIPGYIELTGGSEPEKSLWMAGAYHCAVIDIEWRGTKNKFRSQWPGCDVGAMKSMTSLKDNLAYRLVTGVRRAVDFLEQQPGIDTGKIGCGGGSMGGYYTLLIAGVDDRISFGVDELGAGHLQDTGSALGQFFQGPDYKAVWLQAFDPISLAARTKARIFMNFSADDYFFWLGDGVANYLALAGEKRVSITPNFNHNDGAFGKKKPLAVGWLDYACGRDASYPEIKGVRSEGASYMATATPEVTSAMLCWSPGSQDLAWSARYWLEVPAVRTDAGWKAEVPATYAGLARMAFMSVKDAKARTVSSLPVFTAGIDPSTSPAPLWSGGSLWDTASGISAWRQIGPNVHSGVPARVEATADGCGLRIFPGQEGKPDFSLVSNSALLASAGAGKHRGIRIALNGGSTSGTLTVALVNRFGAATHQQEYKTVAAYKAGESTVDLTWEQFNGASNGSHPPSFDSIRLDGTRMDRTPLEVGSITYLDSAAVSSRSIRPGPSRVATESNPSMKPSH